MKCISFMNYNGLTSEEVEKRKKIYGKNEITRTVKINPLKLFLSQFLSPLVILLLFAALISVLIGFLPGQEPDYIDAFLIFVIVILSSLSGFIQEYKAEKSIEALQEMSIPSIQVMRDGEIIEIPVTDITVGDLVLLEAGDVVPADGKIIESFNFKVDESILTGESDSVDKKAEDEVYMNTSVYVGNAKIKISKVGMQTKVGEIANKLQQIPNERTSFEEEVASFSKKIFWVTGFITVVIFLGNLFKYDLYTSLLTAVSLAVAAIPEGLPAVVVLSLAIGAKTMFKNNALIRRLNVVESIGAVDVVCSDKTGTITKNEMTVVRLFVNNKVYNTEIQDKDRKDEDEFYSLLECGAICNNTKVSGHPEGDRKYIGEQTEIGIIRVAEAFGIYNEKINEQYAKINEIPFSSERKMMSVVVHEKLEKNANKKMFSKGAPEVLIEKCNRILENGKVRKMELNDKKVILSQNENFAVSAYRVLGFAYKEIDDNDKQTEKDLIWIGLEAMVDPPHTEIVDTLKNCQTAGIRVIMITGDNPITAKAIADTIGLKSEGVLEGKDIEKMTVRDVQNSLDENINIFARTTPMHKLKILKVLEKNNRVAMTGDGVNDSLAIKQANVGIAMGQRGTSVAKESSDIVLLDDNFSTIIKAIKEGRRIFDNIRKFMNYLLVSNIAEVFVLFLSVFLFTLDKPILIPVQILWINLLTDGMPALALGVDPARKDIMKDKPRHKNEAIINKRLAWLIGLMGAKKTIVLLITFLLVLPQGEDLARTTLFTGFILYEFVRIASIRSQEKLNWTSNPWLLIALLVSLLLQLVIVYSPLNVFFHAVPLGLGQWFILLSGVCIGYFTALLITKLVSDYFEKKEAN